MMTRKSKYPLSTKRYTLFMEERQPEQRQETDEGGKLEAGEVEVGEGDKPFHVGMLIIKTDTEEGAKETREQEKEKGGQEKKGRKRRWPAAKYDPKGWKRGHRDKQSGLKWKGGKETN